MKEVNTCTSGCKNETNNPTGAPKSLEHIINEPNANNLILERLKLFTSKNQENILQISKSISDPQKKVTPPELKI